jgi:hypothetical protein
MIIIEKNDQNPQIPVEKKPFGAGFNDTRFNERRKFREITRYCFTNARVVKRISCLF